MKKILSLTIVALMGLTASAQTKHFEAQAPAQGKSKVTVAARQLQQPVQTAGHFNGGEFVKSRLNKKVNVNTASLKPAPALVQRVKAVKGAQQGKAFAKGQAQRRDMSGLKPVLSTQTAAAHRGPAKAPQFTATYTGKALDYFSNANTEWTMTPGTATNKEGESVDVFYDAIPCPYYLAELYPEGIPVEYTIEDNTITIEPQAVAYYEYNDTTFYITLFSANSDDEDGIINMELAENGKLTITNGNWICLGEFANVEFDMDLADSEAYMGLDELYAHVRYLYEGQVEGVTVSNEFKAYGIDAESGELVNWTMQQGTYTYDEEETPVLINMTPLLEEFESIFPEGVYVEYTQSGNIITVKPQLIASYTAQDGTDVYLILHSYTSNDGNIVLTLADDGTPETISGESVCIGAWETGAFESTYNTYLGYYYLVDRVHYQLPGAAPLAPEDVACEHANTMLFAGMGISGYHYIKNLSVAGAYAPTSFHNITQDPASGYAWSVEELGDNDDVRTITGDSRDFSLNTIGGYGYQNLKLTCDNQGSKGEEYTWGCMGIDGDTGEALYDSIFVYAGGSQGSFYFSDGTYATMTNKNLDDDIIFYTNFGTPDKASNSLTKIYSYQGKPSTPLYITGIALPFVAFEAGEDFNLHVVLYKCTRDQNGRVTLGDIIAEGDATTDNIDDTYASQSGLTAVNFDELYVEDEMGLSEIVDYLFIEDEWLVCIEGWDNGTFTGVLGSDDKMGGESITTWFEMTGNEGYLYRYTSWKPTLFIGLIDATYGYLHTEDNTSLAFGADGGEASIHVEPMYYTWDEDYDDLPVPSLYLESVTIDGEEEDEVPGWLTVGIANLDQSVDEDGYPNNIDYDLVFAADALDEGTDSRMAEIVYMQRGARLKVTITQGAGAETLKGDVNGDGSVDVADISAIISQMAGASQYAEADVNGDGSVDVADISTVITIMAGN